MAGNSGAIRAGRAYVEIYGDKAPLMSAMKSLPKSVLSASAGLGAVGGVIGGLIAGGITSAFSAVTSFASNLGDVGGRLVDMSDRTGIGVEALAELDHAAQMSGTSLDTLEGGLRKMSVKLADAAGGSKTAVAAFDAIGVSVGELQGMSPDQQFERIADGLASISDPGQRAAATMDIFGKSGADLIPLMKDGSAGIKAFREEAKRLGRITEEDARAVDELGDTFANVQSAMSNAATTVAAAFAPVLNDVGQLLLTGVGYAKDYYVTLGKIYSAVLAANPPLEVLSSGLSKLSNLFDSGLDAMGPWGESIRSVLGEAGNGFSEMYAIASQSLQGIVDAMMVGDLSAAFEVMVASLNVTWQQGLASLGVDWVEIWAMIQDTFNQASTNLVTAWISLSGAIQSIWNELLSNLQSGLVKTQSFIADWLLWAAYIDEKDGYKDAKEALDSEFKSRIAGQTSATQDAKRRIDEQVASQTQAVAQQRDARTAAIRNDAETNSSAKRLADAQARLDAATKAAADKRAAAEASKPVDPAAEMRKTAIAGTSAMFATSAGAISFGGVAAGMAANQGPINKLVDSSEETAENTRVIAKKIGNDGMRA